MKLKGAQSAICKNRVGASATQEKWNDMKRYRWNSISGADLEEAVIHREPLDTIIEPCEAIYLWRRSVVPPPEALRSSRQFRIWIDRCLGTPFSLITDKRLAHFATLEKLVIGGGDLTEEKSNTLKSIQSQSMGRRLLAKFVASLNSFIPPIYAGETKNLPQRVGQHLRGATKFSELMQQHLHLKWSETDLYYYPIGDPRDETQDTESRKARRTLLETIVSQLALAGCVSRIG